MNNLDKIKAIMSNAYARWEQAQNWTQEEFWYQLSYIEKSVVFVGNLNYQVENGGFLQWHNNGYSKCSSELTYRLNEIGIFAQEIAKLVIAAMNEFDSVDNNNENEFSGWYDNEEKEEYNYELLDKFDDIFYDITSNNELLEELADWVNLQ